MIIINTRTEFITWIGYEHMITALLTVGQGRLNVTRYLNGEGSAVRPLFFRHARRSKGGMGAENALTRTSGLKKGDW